MARLLHLPEVPASMKALPKRKGNCHRHQSITCLPLASMKALPKRKGNFKKGIIQRSRRFGLNESPSQKEGKFGRLSSLTFWGLLASMKALPKRKGND